MLPTFYSVAQARVSLSLYLFFYHLGVVVVQVFTRDVTQHRGCPPSFDDLADCVERATKIPNARVASLPIRDDVDDRSMAAYHPHGNNNNKIKANKNDNNDETKIKERYPDRGGGDDIKTTNRKKQHPSWFNLAKMTDRYQVVRAEEMMRIDKTPKSPTVSL